MKRISRWQVFLLLSMTLLGAFILKKIYVKEIVQRPFKEEPVHLIWYQIGTMQKDLSLVLEKVNAYTSEKIGVTLEIKTIGWSEYTEQMKIVMASGETCDLVFTSAWANDYLLNVQKGAFLCLDELLARKGKVLYEVIDPNFWEGVKINGKIYGVPTQKEIASIPMWVFTKEYVDKYQIPYESIHTLENLEPYLQIIKENEPEVIPFYITKNYSVPLAYEQVVRGLGVQWEDENKKIVKMYESEELKKSFTTMHHYYNAGYINREAYIVTDDQSTKRFVTKADGQPFADYIWSRSLGYEVVATPIYEVPIITNESVRGAITAISSRSKYPEKAMELLELVNTDEYLSNLLNYGIEGIHYEKIGKTTIALTEKFGDYSVPYYVQGNLFNTYTVKDEPPGKWKVFEVINQTCEKSPVLGFDFDITPVLKEVNDITHIIDRFNGGLHSGTVDPSVYLPLLNQLLEGAGINKVQEEIQKQIK